MTLLETAMKIALDAHAGALDKQGEPYILHPIRVMLAVRKKGYSEVCQAIALLHDVVEDSEITLDDLRGYGLPEEVVDAVDALTRRKPVETYRAYIERVATSGPVVIAVKVDDLEDNMDPARKCQDKERIVRERYRPALLRLSGTDRRYDSIRIKLLVDAMTDSRL